MQTKFQHLLTEQDGSVLTLTMNRPEVLNAFNDTMLEELSEAMDAAANDESVRCIVLTGAGRAFGSGQDLVAFANRPRGEAGKVSDHIKKYHHVIETIHTMPKPVIAAVRGVAAGISCNFALACDMRVVSDNARFIEAFARIGLVPDGGGPYFLPRLIGMGRALEMALLAEEVNAAEAVRIGLANRMFPDAEFESSIRAFAQRLGSGPTRSYGLIKHLMSASFESDLHTMFELEGEMQDQAFQTEDHHEGLTAFLQKRKAQYKGR